MDTQSNFSKRFWNKDFWLPSSVKWEDLANKGAKKYGQPEDLAVAVALAIVLFCIRTLLEKRIMMPIAMALHLSNKPHAPPEHNIILEKVFCTVAKHPDKKHIEGLCKQLDWSERQVRRWFRKRSLSGRPTTAQKFSETGWRFVFYICSFVYGVYTLYDEECVWNRDSCWADFPDNHNLTTKVYWYYMIELAFYMSTTVTQFFDVKRKDFWEMFIHHFATILLLAGSYVMNFTKMGSFIAVVHDSADFYLEFAKMAKYAEYKRVTNIAFMSFAIAFFISRLVILPIWIIPAIWSGGMELFLPFSVIHFLFPFLLTLQVLHFYWGYHVAGGIYAAVVVGKIERDTRSDTEEDTDESEDFKESHHIGNNVGGAGDTKPSNNNVRQVCN